MARERSSQPDETTLRMALVGYQVEKEKIEQRIREIELQLGRTTTKSPAVSNNGGRPKRVLSAAARKRIAEAQRRRWAAHRKGRLAKS